MSSPPDAQVNLPHDLYRCYDADDQLLYIGVAQNVALRIYHHLATCNYGKQPNRSLQKHMVRYETEPYPTKLAARAAERAAISAEAPLLNRQHNPRRFRKVGMSRYGFVAPVHPLSAEAFTDSEAVA